MNKNRKCYNRVRVLNLTENLLQFMVLQSSMVLNLRKQTRKQTTLTSQEPKVREQSENIFWIVYRKKHYQKYMSIKKFTTTFKVSRKLPKM